MVIDADSGEYSPSSGAYTLRLISPATPGAGSESTRPILFEETSTWLTLSATTIQLPPPCIAPWTVNVYSSGTMSLKTISYPVTYPVSATVADCSSVTTTLYELISSAPPVREPSYVIVFIDDEIRSSICTVTVFRFPVVLFSQEKRTTRRQRINPNSLPPPRNVLCCNKLDIGCLLSSG